MNNLQAWDLFHKGHLFYARDSTKKNSDSHHIAEMIALLGPPTKDMIQSSEYAAEFFDGEGTSSINQYRPSLTKRNKGNWKGVGPISPLTLEQLEGNLHGTQQKLFLEFMRKMLQWHPEERASAKDLLSDPWLRSP